MPGRERIRTVSQFLSAQCLKKTWERKSKNRHTVEKSAEKKKKDGSPERVVWAVFALPCPVRTAKASVD